MHRYIVTAKTGFPGLHDDVLADSPESAIQETIRWKLANAGVLHNATNLIATSYDEYRRGLTEQSKNFWG